MSIYLAIFIGSGLGGLLRFWLCGILDAWGGGAFPWGTLFVNVLGSFIISLFGTLVGAESPWLVSPMVRQFVMIGILGGFTTFSAFSYQTMTLFNEQEWGAALFNVGLSVFLSLLMVYCGHIVALSYLRR